MSPWTQHHFLAISSAATDSKDLKHGNVIELIVLSSYQKKSWILLRHYDFTFDFALKLPLPQQPVLLPLVSMQREEGERRWRSNKGLDNSFLLPAC